MDIKGTVLAILRGFRDSFTGTVTILYLDKEINERLQSRLSPTHSNTPIRRKPSESRETTPVRQLKKNEESKVLRRVFQCGLLNGGIFLFSILLFEYAFLPGINVLLSSFITGGKEKFRGQLLWSWVEALLSLIFKTIWVVPLFLLSKLVNSLWFQDIADSAYKHSRGRPVFMQSISKLLADSIFSIVIQALFLIQAVLVNYIPIYMLGTGLSFIHMCLLYSLYAFEYKWFNMGWELHRRLAYIETNWPYFIGFGIPLTLFTQISDSWIISGCVFSILFPFFIISGNEATPVEGVCDFPLRLFSPVIQLSNSVFSRTIGKTMKPTSVRPKPPAAQPRR